jgi:hypothetical protein
MDPNQVCPDCDGRGFQDVTRREFVKTVGAVAAAASLPSVVLGADEKKPRPENLVKKLYDSLTSKQKEDVCFDWDYTDDRGLLRTFVSNNWHVTGINIADDFFTKDQQEIIEAIFFGLYNPDWHDRILTQLKDDAGGYGKHQNIAIFGEPGTGKFQFLMTGRHLTLRCDGDSADHVAFGGPIFYGHAAQGFNEKPDHPGNVFWPQAVKANALYQMLDGKQRKSALVPNSPRESHVSFRGPQGQFPGIPVTELSSDQKEHLQGVLKLLLEPYRNADKEEALACLNTQGGLDKCSVAFYQSPDIGDDGVWDNWRLEGPSFVWYFRGAPHVHVWVNVADNHSVKLNARG